MLKGQFVAETDIQDVRGSAVPPAGPRKALLLANHHARQVREHIGSVVACLESNGLELVIEHPENSSHFHELITQYREQVDAVIVAGGDGTLNQAVDAIVEADLPLGVIPLGTANDLARTLRIPDDDLEAACRVITQGNMRRIDLGWVDGKHYFNVASLGLSVAITRRLSGEAKKRWGILAYLFTAAKVLVRTRPFEAEIDTGEAVHAVKTVQITIGNGRFYGGGMTVDAQAAIDDQQLDLFSIEVSHWWRIPFLVFALRTGRLKRLSQVRTLTGREFRIRTRKPRAINTDGEVTAHTPAVFRLCPRALSVYSPA